MAAAKAPKPKKSQVNYRQLEDELREIIAWFEGDSFDVDEAVKKYERGLQLLKELEDYIGRAENTVRELKTVFSAKAK